MSKFRLSLLFVATVTSGITQAAVQVGNGTFSISGQVSTTTCTVSPSASSITFSRLSAPFLMAQAADSEVDKQSLTLNFNDCASIGNTLQVQLNRDVNGPTGSDVTYAGGFTYLGGVSTDPLTAPLYYNVKSGNSSLILDGSKPDDIDITAIADKTAFSIPIDIVLNKAADNGIAPSSYAGTYSGNFTYSITYP